MISVVITNATFIVGHGDHLICICITIAPGPDLLEVPPLTPASKEVISQAVKTSFAGFAQEIILHRFPKGNTSSPRSGTCIYTLAVDMFVFEQTPLCGLTGR